MTLKTCSAHFLNHSLFFSHRLWSRKSRGERERPPTKSTNPWRLAHGGPRTEKEESCERLKVCCGQALPCLHAANTAFSAGVASAERLDCTPQVSTGALRAVRSLTWRTIEARRQAGLDDWKRHFPLTPQKSADTPESRPGTHLNQGTKRGSRHSFTYNLKCSTQFKILCF